MLNTWNRVSWTLLHAAAPRHTKIISFNMAAVSHLKNKKEAKQREGIEKVDKWKYFIHILFLDIFIDLVNGKGDKCLSWPKQ